MKLKIGIENANRAKPRGRKRKTDEREKTGDEKHLVLTRRSATTVLERSMLHHDGAPGHDDTIQIT